MAWHCCALWLGHSAPSQLGVPWPGAFVLTMGRPLSCIVASVKAGRNREWLWRTLNTTDKFGSSLKHRHPLSAFEVGKAAEGAFLAPEWRPSTRGRPRADIMHSSEVLKPMDLSGVRACCNDPTSPTSPSVATAASFRNGCKLVRLLFHASESRSRFRTFCFGLFLGQPRDLPNVRAAPPAAHRS